MHFSLSTPRVLSRESFIQWDSGYSNKGKKWFEVCKDKDDIEVWIGKLYMVISKVRPQGVKAS